MIRSMTGYGRYELVDGKHKLTVEFKSVNHRYLDLAVKMPRLLNCFEAQIRSLIKQNISRGKVDININYELEGSEAVVLKYNKELAAQYCSYMRQMAQEFNIADELSNVTLARMPDVLSMEQEDPDAKELWPLIEKAVEQAEGLFIESRLTEGEKLKKDLLDKLSHMEELADMVCERAPRVVEEYRCRLYEKLKEIVSDVAVDENRIAAEVTIYADRICVDEELVRLRTHIEHMRDELTNGGLVGRKLDFLAQEMNREANTTLSKMSDVSVSDLAIDMKTEIEKIREQIQNLE